MDSPGRVLALDVGDKTIGVAISDALGITAQGLFTLQRTSARKDTEAVKDIVKEHGCGRVVVGLPIGLDGMDSIQTAKVREFAGALENKLRSNAMQDVAVELFDERFTTKIAERVLIEGGVRHQKRKAVIDTQAAVVILTGYLEGKRR